MLTPAATMRDGISPPTLDDRPDGLTLPPLTVHAPPPSLLDPGLPRLAHRRHDGPAPPHHRHQVRRPDMTAVETRIGYPHTPPPPPKAGIAPRTPARPHGHHQHRPDAHGHHPLAPPPIPPPPPTLIQCRQGKPKNLLPRFSPDVCQPHSKKPKLTAIDVEAQGDVVIGASIPIREGPKAKPAVEV